MKTDKKLNELHEAWDAEEERCSKEIRNPFTDIARLLINAWKKHAHSLYIKTNCGNKPPTP